MGGHRAQELSGCCGPALSHRQGHGICIAGQCSHIGQHPTNRTLWRPTQQSCAAPNFVLDGPMQASCANITVHEMGPHECLRLIISRLLWASSVSSARPWHLHCRPMWPHWSAAIPANRTLWRPTRQSRAAPNFVLDGPMRACCADIEGHEMGPHECLHLITFRLLWASASW